LQVTRVMRSVLPFPLNHNGTPIGAADHERFYPYQTDSTEGRSEN